jgi:AAA15 family ATPase/GTPase
MLLRLTANNYLSFKENSEFNMFVGKNYKSHPEHVKTTKSGVSLIKTAALYGANGAGKSNLVAVLEYLRQIILDEYQDESMLLPSSSKFKLEEEYASKPTSFRIEYESDELHFDYAIEIFKGEVIDEWLYHVIDAQKDVVELIFRRKKDKQIEFGIELAPEDASFIRGFEKKMLKRNQPFLSVVPDVLEDYKLLMSAFNWFGSLRVITPHSETLSVPIISSKEDIRKFASHLLNSSKTGVLDILVKEVKLDVFFSYDEEDERKELEEVLKDIIERHGDDEEEMTKYQFGSIFMKNGKLNYATYNEEMIPVVLVLNPIHHGGIQFELDEESDGTNRLLELAPIFYNLLEKDSIVVIDEIERSMHPILAKRLLELFLNNSKTKSQLIFTTHESNLLDQALLRQDEIWFVEKKEDGSSELYPLSDFGERFDKDIRKGYLQGRYGAIPFMSNLDDLNWNG